MLNKFFRTESHRNEKKTLPILNSLIQRYKDEKPFDGVRIAIGHLLVRNTIVVIEALLVGGADLIISEGFPSPAAKPVIQELRGCGLAVLENNLAAQRADIYLDVNALLGRLNPPKSAVEITRTGILHYQKIDCVVVSADDCKAKKIEGFFGTGDGFVRAWKEYFPEDPLLGKQIVQFGYGKIGHGAAFRSRAEGANVIVVEIDGDLQNKAVADGFSVIDGNKISDLENTLKKAEIVNSITGIPNILSKLYPPEWFRVNAPKLVNLGAEDEYGELFDNSEILGGKSIPFNFHLSNPTQNRYIDPALSAHLLGLEALLVGNYENGIHPLPLEMDDWLVSNWRAYWPDEDLIGIADELGIN